MEDVAEGLKWAVVGLYGVAVEPEVTLAPADTGADYASNVALRLAKTLHKAPMTIATEIKAQLEGIAVNEKLPQKRQTTTIDKRRSESPYKIEVVRPGFLNFISSDEYFMAEIADYVQNFAENISLDEYRDKTVVCEFSDPNPFKVLHVGHLYTSVVGDAIARLFEEAGAKVVRVNFGGDVGLHVAKTLYALERKLEATAAEPIDWEKKLNAQAQKDFPVWLQRLGGLTIEDIASCYVEGTAQYEENAQAKATIDALNREIYTINAENRYDTAVAQLYWQGRELSYRYFDDFYAKIGVHFDKYYPESSVAALGQETVQRELEKGVYERSDGAVVFNGEKYGLHTRVFVNRLGVPTYETKDVGLILTKWRDFHFDRSVVITGNEQLDYMKVVLKSVEQYAPELVARTTHLTHGLVKLLGNEKMSSRKGNFLKAVEVLELVEAALEREYGSKDWRVVLAAVKYAFLRYKMGSDIIFDPAESVKMTGNSGPYLLYSCVRAKKILAKTKDAEDDVARRKRELVGRESTSVRQELDSAEQRLTSAERELIKRILAYRAVLREAVTEMAPHKVAGYLYELAQDFSRFYENCPVAGSAQEPFRRQLVQVYLTTMTHGLNLLGIEVPEEM